MATYYIDYNRGNDATDGTSSGAGAWQNISKLAGTFADDDFVILDDESTWDFALDGRQGFGTLGARFTLTRSGTNGSQKPTMRRKPSVASGSWTYDAGNNGWYIDLGFTPGVMSGIMLGGEHWAHKQVDALPLVSSDYTWRESSNRVYLYAPAGQDPTTYYGEVILCSGDRGLLTFSSDGSDVLVDGIAFDDYGLGILLYANSGTRQYTVRNCETLGGKLVHVNTDTAGTLTAIIEYNRCRIAPSAFIQTLGSLGQGTHIIRHNDLATCNLGHPQGGIYLQNLSGALIYDNDIEDAKFGDAFQTSDGCAIYAEVGSNNVSVFGNTIRRSHLAMQDNSGRRTVWSGNLAVDCYGLMKVGDQSAVGATDHTFVNNTGVNLGYPIATLGAANVATIGWRMIDVASDLFRVVNSLFVKYPGSTDTQPAIETPETAAAGSQIATNCIYGFTDTVLAYDGGAAAPTATGTITDDPLLDASYRLGAGSPCINAGTLLADVVLKDFYGKDIDDTPDIGAMQVYAARSAIASRSAITRSAITRSAHGKRAVYG